MKIWKRLMSGLLGLMLLASLGGTALAAGEAPKEKAAPAGEFSQWFSWLGTNSESPETQEKTLASMGTAVKQSKTAGGVTVTLDGALWDGGAVYLSLTAKGPNIPEKLTKESWIYSEECSLKLQDEHWKEYVQKEQESYAAEANLSKEQLEKNIQNQLSKGQILKHLSLDVESREGDTVHFKASLPLEAFVEKPELTLHLENVAIYEEGKGSSVSIEEGKRSGPGPGVSILKGPFDFTFTLEKRLDSISYTGEVKMKCKEIPVCFTKIKLSPFQVAAECAVDAEGPVNLLGHGEKPAAGKLNIGDELEQDVRGIWLLDGSYVDCAGSMALTGYSISKEGLETVKWSRFFPRPIAPASVAAVDLAGTRVELSEMKAVAE